MYKATCPERTMLWSGPNNPQEMRTYQRSGTILSTPLFQGRKRRRGIREYIDLTSPSPSPSSSSADGPNIEQRGDSTCFGCTCSDCRTKQLEKRNKDLNVTNAKLSMQIKHLRDELDAERSVATALRRHFTCPVCRNSGQSALGFGRCGHAICMDCIASHQIIEMEREPESEEPDVRCPECRGDFGTFKV